MCDDKAGLLADLTVLDLLSASGAENYGELVLLCTPDEEIGSPTSRDDIARLAVGADADAEPGLDGALTRVRSLVDTVYVPGTAASMTVSGACPPWRPGHGQSGLLAHTRAIAYEFGFEGDAVASGGAADADYAAAAGVPTLDGLGPVGGDDPSVDEWLDLASVVPRIAMLAGLVSRVSTSAITWAT